MGYQDLLHIKLTPLYLPYLLYYNTKWNILARSFGMSSRFLNYKSLYSSDGFKIESWSRLKLLGGMGNIQKTIIPFKKIINLRTTIYIILCMCMLSDTIVFGHDKSVYKKTSHWNFYKKGKYVMVHEHRAYMFLRQPIVQPRKANVALTLRLRLPIAQFILLCFTSRAVNQRASNANHSTGFFRILRSNTSLTWNEARP
jgi:hypothetical protein